MSEDGNEKLNKERRLSLGFYEKIDLERVIMFLVEQKEKKEFILWGRSMGAVTI